MRKIFILFLGLTIGLPSCSKKNNVSPPDTVNINGTVYPTLVTNGQTWTTQNYRGPGGGEIAATGDDAVVNGNYYNKLNITLPAGWRIPTFADFNNLLSTYSGNKGSNGDDEVNLVYTNELRSIDGWHMFPGNNGSGFNAYPGGFINGSSISELIYKGDHAFYLSSTISDGNTLFLLNISDVPSTFSGFTFYTGFTAGPYANDQASFYCSVRFVKDN